jgi:hypothetical protein
MKKRMCRLLASLALLLAFISGAQGGFKLEPLGPEKKPSLVSVFGQRHCFYQPDLKAGKLPEGAKDVKLGQVALDCVNPILFATWSSADEKGLDTLVFDLNGDQDLTNDPKYPVLPLSQGALSSEAGKEIEVQFPKGPTAKIKVALAFNFMLLKSDLCLKGELDLQGKKYKAAVINASRLGLASKEGGIPILLLDTNGDGRFEDNMSMAMGKELFYLGSGVNIEGTLYDYKFDKEKLDIQLTPYTGPQGKLNLQIDLDSKVKTWTLSGDLAGENHQQLFSGTGKEFPLAVKTGTCQLLDANLTLEMEDGKNFSLQFETPEPLKIENGATFTLPIGKPQPFEVTLKQSNEILSIGRVFKGGNGIQYGRVQTIESKNAQNVLSLSGNGGKVVIQDATGKQIGEGSLEYG